MKLFWMTFIVAAMLWAPGPAQAQGAQDPLPMQPNSEHWPAGPGNLSTDRDTAIPNPRIPGITPPKAGESHPVTPDDAWPKPPPSTKAVPEPVTPHSDMDAADRILSGKEEPASDDLKTGIGEAGELLKQ